jgi:hypothetical protein
MWREEDDLYRTATTRTAAVALFSVAVLLLPRTAPIRWWAVAPAVACLVGGLVCARLRGRAGRLLRWPSLVALSHHALTQTGVGFASVAVGGVEGNQRFLSMLVLVVTASYSPALVVGIAWAIATATIFWSSVVGGLSGEVAFTVTVMFGASAAAVASIVHLLLTRIRRQNRQVRLTAALAASVARAQQFDEELPEILALTSAVLGGVPLALSRVDPERIIVPLGVQLQIEGAVAREQLQHVVEEPDTGRHLVAPLALDTERDVDPGLAGVPRDHAFPHSSSSMASMHAWVWATNPVVMRMHPAHPGCRSRSRT